MTTHMHTQVSALRALSFWRFHVKHVYSSKTTPDITMTQSKK